jgi:hypothetical protein
VLNNGRAGYGQTARELARSAGFACESLKNNYTDRETEQREQAKHLPERRSLCMRFGHCGSVTPD